MRFNFNKDTKLVKNLDDDTLWRFDYMEVYDNIDENSAMIIHLREANVDIEDAEIETITFYPLLESIPESLKAHDFEFVEE